MGLGLFLARAFAERHGGQLVLASDEGKGTRVTLELPTERRMTAASVLVVDDDETYRARLVRAFQAREYEAQGAPDGESAVALAKKESPEYAVVDLRMPGISGLDVVRELKAIDTATNIVVLTDTAASPRPSKRCASARRTT